MSFVAGFASQSLRVLFGVFALFIVVLCAVSTFVMSRILSPVIFGPWVAMPQRPISLPGFAR